MKSVAEKRTEMAKTENAVVTKNNYELTGFNMDKVEELETAIAPGGFGFGCGCKGVFGAFCGH